MCKGANTKPETCECLDGYTPETDGVGCREKEPGASMGPEEPGMIVGSGDNTDGSVKVDD